VSSNLNVKLLYEKIPNPLFGFSPNHKICFGDGVDRSNKSFSGNSHSGTTRISGEKADMIEAFFLKAILQFHVTIFISKPQK
jgi:hypothetical protein